MHSTLLLLVAAVVLFAPLVLSQTPPSSGTCSVVKTCNAGSFGPSDCFACCGGICVGSYPSRKLGETCDNACIGTCEVGSCISNRCQRPFGANVGPGCPCASASSSCGSYGSCDFNATRPTSQNICRPSSLPAGATCVFNTDCIGGASCLAGKCVAIASGQACSRSQNRCAPPLGCVSVETPGDTSTQCLSRRNTGAKCSFNDDCVSGTCDLAVEKCVDAFSLTAGTNCTDSAGYQCESHLCLPNLPGDTISATTPGRCAVASYSRGAGELCPNGDVNCRAGFKCVGSKDATCAPRTGKLCSGSSDCGNGFCLCSGVTSRCAATTQPKQECDALALEYRTVLRAYGFGSPSMIMPFHLMPTGFSDIAARYLCCLYTHTQGTAGL